MPTLPNVLYADNFTGYPLGSFPTGWGGDFFGGSHIITDPYGVYPRALQYFSSVHVYKDLLKFYGDVTIYCAINTQGGFGNQPFIVAFENASPNEGLLSQYLACVSIESDRTLSCRGGGNTGGGTLIANSAPFCFSNGWNYLQINASFTSVIDINGFAIVWAKMGIALNGQIIIPLTSGSTGVHIAGLYNAAPLFNYWVFNDPTGNAGLLANVSLCAPSASLGNNLYEYTGPTFTGSKANAFASQNFIEVMALPYSPNARMSQGFIEVVELPTSMQARASQNFIELITTGQESLSSTWDVKES